MASPAVGVPIFTNFASLFNSLNAAENFCVSMVAKSVFSIYCCKNKLAVSKETPKALLIDCMADLISSILPRKSEIFLRESEVSINNLVIICFVMEEELFAITNSSTKMF